MKQCKFQNCAVCKEFKYRDIFKYAFKNRVPDIYICLHASYKIINTDGDYFIINDLEQIKTNGIKGYYIIDKYNGRPIYLSTDNFQIICNTNECTIESPIVVEFQQQHKKSLAKAL